MQHPNLRHDRSVWGDVLAAIGLTFGTLLALFWTGFTVALLRRSDPSRRTLVWFGLARACGSWAVAVFFVLALLGVRGKVLISVLVAIFLAAVVHEIAGRRFRAHEGQAEVDADATGS